MSTPHLALPPGWFGIPLVEPRIRADAVRRLIHAQFKGSSASASLRTDAAREVTMLVDAAAGAGGLLMALSTASAGDVPLAMSMTMLRPRPRLSIETVVASYLGQQGVATARSASAGVVVRRVSRLPARGSSTASPLSLGSSPLAQLTVDYWLTPDDDGALHVVFSTPLVEAQDPLLDLFDSMVATIESV